MWAFLLAVAVIAVAVDPASGLRAQPPCMMARKSFKGGRLDDFLSAGEAEAKYGPQRYAAVAEDAWKLEVSRAAKEAARKRTELEYEAQKSQMLQDHAFLSLMGVTIMWSAFNLQITVSYVVGTFLGGLYIYLLQRQVDSVGASTIEEVSRLPPPIVVPVIMVLLVAKNPNTIMLLPTFAGFGTNYLATLLEAAYPPGWGVPSEAADE